MNRNVIRFWERLKKADDREYLLSVILFSAAPTIAGLKPATLLCLGRTGRDLYDLWNRDGVVAGVCRNLGLEFICLDKSTTMARVLFFRRILLEKRVMQKQCRSFLIGYGYPGLRRLNVNAFLDELAARFCQGVPHEVGIFLGFPLSDVLGFIAQQGEGYLLNGYWKVYSQPLVAQIRFSLYDQAKLAMIAYLNCAGGCLGF